MSHLGLVGFIIEVNEIIGVAQITVFANINGIVI